MIKMKEGIVMVLGFDYSVFMQELKWIITR
jgi:hypothetical protein